MATADVLYPSHVVDLLPQLPCPTQYQSQPQPQQHYPPHQPQFSDTASQASDDLKSKDVNGNPELAESLVFTASLIIESIWHTRPASSPATCTSQPAPSAANPTPALAPLSRVIQELLRRSRTSCSTFQLSLLYLIKLRNALLIKGAPSCPATGATPSPSSSAISLPNQRPSIPVSSPIRCGRRMFLAALILANKYLQDKNYSMKAWAKICGLDAAELCANERLFLSCINYELFVPQHTWAKWSGTIIKRVEIVRERREKESRSRQMVTGWLQGLGGGSMTPPISPMMPTNTILKPLLPRHVAVAAPPTPPQEPRTLSNVAEAAPLSLKRGRSPASLLPSISVVWNGLPSPVSDVVDTMSAQKRRRLQPSDAVYGNM